MTASKVSIVTLTFNNYEELRYTLQSVPQWPEVESVVVNGGSCQQTKQFLDNEHVGISLSESDQGISDGFNKGVALSTGTYIMLLNSGDILIDPAYLKEVISYLDEHPEIGICHADMYFLHPEKGKTYHPPKRRFPGMPYNHPTMIVRKQTYIEVGKFNLDYKYTMDLDWVSRASKLGVRDHYFPKAVVEMDGDGVSTTQEGKSMMEAMKVSLKNNSIGGISGFFELSLVITKIYVKTLLIHAGLWKKKQP